MTSDALKTFVLAALAILAFAGNSLLTKMALAVPGMDAAPFVVIRLVSGALVLAALMLRKPAQMLPKRVDWPGVLALLAYAVAFTLAYVRLGVATGALILFSTVQITLAVLAAIQGTAPTLREGTGLLIALAGLAILLMPGLTAPPLLGAALMIAAGIAWGVYTLLGRGATDPVPRTARNFIGAAPLACLLLLFFPHSHVTTHGIWLAIASGAVTSGLGYVIWYAVLPKLNVATAGAAQLLVPVITAAVGILLLNEAFTLKFALIAVMVLSGIWLARGAPKRT
ncbi:MAG TPA: DMT family transporter [Asticcacaulis sp.]|nr:DMT family transporter [Asticcacaulis sp.]